MATFNELITEMDQNLRKLMYAWDKQAELFKSLSEDHKENQEYQRETFLKDVQKEAESFYQSVKESMEKAENYITHLTPEKLESDINKLVDDVSKQAAKVSEDMEKQFSDAQSKIANEIDKASDAVADGQRKAQADLKMQEANLKFKTGMNYLGEALKSFQDSLSIRLKNDNAS